MSDDTEDIKEEPEPEPEPEPSQKMDEDEEPLAFGPAALGLHRVGTKLPPKPAPTQPIQVLNARGMPARIRKKNKLFFDDDIVNEKPPKNSPKRSAKSSPIKTPSKILKKRKVISKYMKPSKEDESDSQDISPSESPVPTATAPIDKKVTQRIGLRLRNLLKLPKAHKFVSYEWFYSNIDRPLFEGDNDFQICLKESFPQLKTRLLSRVEWTKIRRMMGKPRRCSEAFFEEERRELERKRQKIRLLQSRKSGDVSFVKDLPNEIPLPLPVGTRVTARLRRPQDGLFTGVLAAVDSLNSTYRITFDRPGLGTHVVPDYELLSNEPLDTIPLSSITQNFRPKTNVPCFVASPLNRLTSVSKNDPMLSCDVFSQIDKKFQPKPFVFPKETIGGYPLKLLEYIVRTRKTLAIKQAKLNRLQELNSEAAINKSYDEPISEETQRRYASIVISLEKINRDMQDYLNQIQALSRHIIREPQMSMLTPSYLREKCREMGNESVQKNNQGTVTNENVIGLISNLAMIMWVASNLSNNDQYSHVLRVLEGCIEETKNKLDDENVDIFQKSVMIHIHHIKLGLGQISSSAIEGVTPTSTNEI